MVLFIRLVISSLIYKVTSKTGRQSNTNILNFDILKIISNDI